MANWLDDLKGKVIRVAGVELVQRKYMNFVSGATVADNPATGATDVTISGGGGGSPFAGSNPNAGGDIPTNGARGDFLRNTGVWNGFEGWSCITTGTPGVWVPVARGGNVIGTSVSYQVLSTDRMIRITSTAAVRTITLPDVTTITKGYDVPIKDCSFSATGNDSLIVGHGGELIDGSASASLIADGLGNAITAVWNGTTWDLT